MVERDDRDGVAVLRMTHRPANVLATPFCAALADSLDGAASDDGVRAAVLTGTDSIFSGGVDLFRLLEGGAAYLESFFPALDRLFRGLYVYPKPLVAALNGHAIAGGFVLACGCDFRLVARGGATLGAPELRVGVPFPGVALDLIAGAVPARHLREVVLRGRIFDVEEALARGLVDEAVEPEGLLGHAVELARELGALPPRAFALTRRQLAAGRSIRDDAQTEAEVRSVWEDVETHARIRAYLERTFGESDGSS